MLGSRSDGSLFVSTGAAMVFVSVVLVGEALPSTVKKSSANPASTDDLSSASSKAFVKLSPEFEIGSSREPNEANDGLGS